MVFLCLSTGRIWPRLDNAIRPRRKATHGMLITNRFDAVVPDKLPNSAIAGTG
jgi:hypothetical protein